MVTRSCRALLFKRNKITHEFPLNLLLEAVQVFPDMQRSGFFCIFINMYTKEQILNILSQKKPEQQGRYPISELGILRRMLEVTTMKRAILLNLHQPTNLQSNDGLNSPI